jgi:hypothetical protein
MARVLLETAGEMLHFCAWYADSQRRGGQVEHADCTVQFLIRALACRCTVPASASPSRVSLVMAADACSEARVGWMIV